MFVARFQMHVCTYVKEIMAQKIMKKKKSTHKKEREIRRKKKKKCENNVLLCTVYIWLVSVNNCNRLQASIGLGVSVCVNDPCELHWSEFFNKNFCCTANTYTTWKTVNKSKQNPTTQQKCMKCKAKYALIKIKCTNCNSKPKKNCCILFTSKKKTVHLNAAIFVNFL